MDRDQKKIKSTSVEIIKDETETAGIKKKVVAIQKAKSFFLNIFIESKKIT